MPSVPRSALGVAGVLVTAALVVPGGAAQAAPVVVTVPLPTPAGSTSTFVGDVNDAGVAVGYATVNGAQRALRWSGLRYTQLPTPAEDPGSSATRVNATGTAAGSLSLTGLSNVVIRRWLPDGTTSDCTPPGNTLGVTAINAAGETLNSTVLAPHVFSASVCHADGTSEPTGLTEAFALTDDGRVAGYVSSGSFQDGSFIYQPVVRAADGTVTQLPVPAGKSGKAYAFGPSGLVVGVIGTASLVLGGPIPFVRFDVEQAVVWQNGELTQLGTLGGATSQTVSSQRTVSATGDVVGSSVTASGETHAFLWHQGQLTDLGTLGGTSSSASAINNRGQVIGTSTTRSGASHAFLWSKGRMIDLGAPRGSRSAAVDINNSGQIVGYTQVEGSTDYRAVRWTVVGS